MFVGLDYIGIVRRMDLKELGGVFRMKKVTESHLGQIFNKLASLSKK